MSCILLVEDDQALGATLKGRLEKEGYEIHWARTCREAEDMFKAVGAKRSPPALAILDIGLPDGSGLELARRLKEGEGIPLVFLSAMNSAEFRLEGFEIGADDYIPKPFHLRELLLRIKRVLEIHGQASLRRVDAGAFLLEPESLALVTRDGQHQALNKRDFEVLYLLVTQSPRVLSREDILKKFWKGDADQTGRTVDNAIMRLRQVLRVSDSDWIKAVRGVGYQWIRR